MKRIGAALIIGLALIACQNDENSLTSEFTGNEVTYALYQASLYPVSGSVTFKEKRDGSAQIEVKLTGTSGDLVHPVHLHLGNVSVDNAELAATLNPVLGKKGLSETNLKMLANESPVTYDQLKQMDACIKIHLAEAGPDQDIILAGGNIGSAAGSLSGGRIKITICKSE